MHVTTTRSSAPKYPQELLCVCVFMLIESISLPTTAKTNWAATVVLGPPGGREHKTAHLKAERQPRPHAQPLSRDRVRLHGSFVVAFLSFCMGLKWDFYLCMLVCTSRAHPARLVVAQSPSTPTERFCGCGNSRSPSQATQATRNQSFTQPRVKGNVQP